MKVNGNNIPASQEEVVVIPRGELRMIFKARLVRSEDHARFDELCKQPEPRTRKYPDGRVVPDYDNAAYKEKLVEFNRKNNAYVVLKSLEATEGLEWDTVDMADCETWPKYEQELRDNGFSDTEIGAIMGIVIEANGMNDRRIKDATDSFLAEVRLMEAGESSQQDAL